MTGEKICCVCDDGDDSIGGGQNEVGILAGSPVIVDFDAVSFVFLFKDINCMDSSEMLIFLIKCWSDVLLDKVVLLGWVIEDDFCWDDVEEDGDVLQGLSIEELLDGSFY